MFMNIIIFTSIQSRRLRAFVGHGREETGMYRLMTRCLVYLGNVGETRQATVSVTRSDDSTWSKDVKIAHTESWNDYSWGDS